MNKVKEDMIEILALTKGFNTVSSTRLRDKFIIEYDRGKGKKRCLITISELEDSEEDLFDVIDRIE